MTKLVGILGYPLGHSISPAFQQAAFDYYGLDVRYEAWETAPEDLEKTLGKLKGSDFLGANVTVPHKEAVAPHLDQIDDRAKSIGAVNTIINRDGSLVGYNTDIHGFLRALTQDGAFSPKGKSVLVMGVGGVARAVCIALGQEGVASIAMTDIILERAQTMAGELQAWVSQVDAFFPEPEVLARTAPKADLIVNCTPLGMKHSQTEKETPLTWDMISADALVYDLVYNPPETPLLREAKRAGARILYGLPMLVYQGAESFRLWTDRDAPIEVMFKAAKEALGI